MNKKIILSFLLVFSLLFSISCNNTDTTGPDDNNNGGGGANWASWYLTETEQSMPFHQVSKPFETGNTIYRIPAIVQADNGNIIAFGDDRKTHGADVGQGRYQVDVMYTISRNGGKTWEEKKYIGPMASQPPADGSAWAWDSTGDVVVFKAESGKLIALCASGGAWFNGANDASPSKVLKSVSTDHGETWTPFQEATEFRTILYGSPTGVASTSQLYRRGFIASGRGLTITEGPYKGRLIAAMLVQFTDGLGGGTGMLPIYSDDEGESWKAGNPTVNSGRNSDEPKVVVQLNDGSILASVRGPTAGNRYFATSTDGGVNFTDLVNNIPMQDGKVDAEATRLTTTKLGHDKDRIVHVTCNDTVRKNLYLYVSEDEAKSWTPTMQLNPDYCSYSSITTLGDGTLLVYGEETTTPGKGSTYNLVARRINLFTLTGGQATFKTEWYTPIK